MITKRQRGQVTCPVKEPSEDQCYERFKQTITYLEKVQTALFRIPVGYYECPACQGKPFYEIPRRKKPFIGEHKEKVFMFSICSICEGTGCIDFVTNAMPPDETLYDQYGFEVPLSACSLKKMDLAAITFYSLYEQHNYRGFNINFKNPARNQPKYKYVAEFVEHFIKYRKDRNKRKQFIEKNFDYLYNELQKASKVDNPELFGKDISKCSLCDAQPFSIIHDEYDDRLKIAVCGKCYGLGIESKKDSKALINKYIADLTEGNYSHKKDMHGAILLNAMVLRDSILEVATKT